MCNRCLINISWMNKSRNHFLFQTASGLNSPTPYFSSWVSHLNYSTLVPPASSHTASAPGIPLNPLIHTLSQKQPLHKKSPPCSLDVFCFIIPDLYQRTVREGWRGSPWEVPEALFQNIYSSTPNVPGGGGKSSTAFCSHLFSFWKSFLGDSDNKHTATFTESH